MKLKEIIIILLIMCCIFSLQALGAAEVDMDNTDDSVLTTTDLDVVNAGNDSSLSLSDSNEVLSEGGESFTQLNDEINGGGTVNLYKNYTYVDTDSAFQGGISITKDTHIIGNGNIVIDASKKARIFTIASGTTVTLQGITFINANGNGNGGAIISQGVLNVVDCKFINNTANGGNGGALILNGPSSTITGSCFDGNTAIFDSTKPNRNGVGGSVMLAGNNIAIRNSNFTNNKAGLNGGAIGSADREVPLNNCTIIGCNFENNVANGSAGAVGMQFTNFNMYNSTFRNNEAKGLTSTGFPGNGGGIVLRGSDSYVYNSTFINNTANNGGASFLTNTSTVSTNNNTGFDYCTFTDNTANYNGGAVNWVSSTNEGYMRNSNFTNNFAKRSGGAIYWSGGNGVVSNCTFTRNNASGIIRDMYGDFLGGGDGGAILWIGSHGIVKDNCIFTDNYAKYRGGAIFLHGSDTVNCTNVTIDHSSFDSNYAGMNGGAVDWNEGSHEGNIYYSTFTNNVAGGNGGAVFWCGHEGQILHSNFTHNYAKGDMMDAYGDIGDGGAIIWIGLNGAVDDCRFIDNIANRRGGAAYLENCTHGNCTNTTFMNSYFKNNTAGTNGGAIDWHDGASDGHVSNSVFEQNVAKRSGGAIYWNGHNGEIINSNFTGNKALGENNATDAFGNVTYGGDGGAVIWIGSNGTVDNCRFIDNIAVKRGGAVYLQGTSQANCENTTFMNSYFKNNTAGTNGGAIDWNKGAHNGHVNAVEFVNNTAGRSGGAVYWNGNDGEILHSNFTGNKALGVNNATDAFGVVTYGGDGGALIWIGYQGTVDDCRFVDNEAAKRGGAVYLQGTSEANCTDTTFKNSYFRNNTAGTNGGAIDWNKGAHNGLVDHVEFINNTAKRSGGAIYWNGDNGTIQYSKFYNNKALGNATGTTPWGEVTNGGDGGAVIWTGAIGTVERCNFVNNTAAKRGGAVFLQGNQEESCENTTFKNSFFANNVAGTNGGAIDWFEGAQNGVVDNVTFVNNTAKRNGGAIYWYGVNGTVKNSKFDNNRATGEALEYDMSFNMATDIKVVKAVSDIPLSSGSVGKLFVINQTSGGIDHFESYVVEDKGNGNYELVKLDEIDVVRSESIISPVDWAIDQFFGGDGGTILWSGDVGLVYNCTFIESNSARRGGGAYMTGSDNVTFDLCYFENCTSGTNGGGVDWLAGANYGKIYNTVFNNTRAARSAGAIYYDGDYGDMKNITIINTTSYGGSLKTSRDGLVKYAGWDSSHWDTNTTGGDAGAIMITGDYLYIYNATFTDCIAAGRGGAIFLQDNVNATIESCTFEHNYARGDANNTWANYTQERDDSKEDTKVNYKLTGHGGAIAFDVNAGYCQIIDSKFYNNLARRNGGAINFDEGSVNNNIWHSEFINNTVYDDGGAINFDYGADYCHIYNSLFNNNTALGKLGSTSKGGTICLVGNNVTIEDSQFILGAVYADTGAKDNETWGGGIFVTGNNTVIKNATFTNCTALEDGGALYVIGDNCQMYNSTFNHNRAGDDGGAIYWQGDHGVMYNITCVDNKVTGETKEKSRSKGGTICLTGNNTVVDQSSFKLSSAIYDGGAIYVTGNNVNITNSEFEMCNVSQGNDANQVYGGGSIYVLGNFSNIVNCSFDKSNAKRGGIIYIEGHDVTIDNATSVHSFALYGGAIYVKGVNSTVTRSNITLANATNDGGTIYIIGEHTRIINSTFDESTARAGGAIYIDGIYASIINSTFNNTSAKTGNVYEKGNFGGAVYIKGNYADISGSNFTDSSAYRGGVVYIEGNYANVSESSFNNSYASWDGGAIYSTGANSNVVKSNFTNNIAGYDGGAIFWFGSDNSINNVVDGCIFVNNIAYAPGGTITVDGATRTTRGGGAIYWSEGGSDGVVRNSQFINNSVQTNNKADGGAILWDKGSHSIIDNCTFDGNYVTTSANGVWVQGGAIYLRPNTDLVINNSEFKNSWSMREAGALYIDSTVTTGVYVVNTKFINNTAKGVKANEGDNDKGGGAVMLKGLRNTWFINTTFINNTANYGGALTVWKLKESSIYIINSTFDGNKATGGETGSNHGGSIYGLSRFNIVNVTILNSEAEIGGGAYFTENVQCDNLTFINNTATNNAGGLYWNKENVNIKNMVFLNNTAANNGGALYLEKTGVKVTDVNMTGNKAFSGSAIYSINDIELTNVYLIDNQANSSSLELTKFDERTGEVELLFKGNDRYLNAIYLQGSGTTLTATNVTFWDADGVNNTGAAKKQYNGAADPTPEAGQNITVTIFDDAGNVIVNKTFVTDRNGKISFNLADVAPDLDPSRYNEVYIEAQNYDEYYTAIKITSRVPSEINASATKTPYHSNSTLYVNVTGGATGNVSVYYGETFLTNITLNNSKGSVNISTLVDGLYLPVGNHTLTFIYNGNAKYDTSNTTAVLEITKITPTLLVNTTGIGYNLVVNVTVMDGEYGILDATGTVTVKVGDRTATIFLGNSQGMTIIYGLPIGNYTVNATYNGDNNYYPVSNSTEANVTEKTQTVLVLDVDSERIYFINETVPIKVTILPDAVGNITLYINGAPHVLPLQHDGNSTFVTFNATELNEGINYVFATYEGTELFAPSWAQDVFHVIKYNSTIKIDTENIPVGETEVINITLPEDAEGVIKVLVNGTPYLVELVNGTAQVNVSGLGIGTYNVTVIFEGDKKYYNSTNSTLFNVTKVKPGITVEVANITYNNDTIVVVTLPDGVSGNVTIKLNNSIVFTEEPIDGKATFVIPDLAAGNYTVEAIFNGNEKYLANSNSTNFTVFKATPVIDITVEDINYGESANITVTVTPGVNGTVIIRINGTETEPLTLIDGKVNITVTGLAVGKYPVEVIYRGNDNYTNATASAEFNVLPVGTVLDVEVHDIPVWDKEYINVTIKDSTGVVLTNATGNVTININGVDYTAEIKDGVARFNTSDLAIGHKVAWVFYDGDRNFTGSKAMAEFDVTQRTPVINITAQNITVGQDGNITVNVPTNATGFVIIEVIGDDTYVKFVSNGKAVINPKDLPVGNYTVKATYYGGNNDNYTITSSEPVNFTVSKLNATLTVEVDDINYTETAIVTVTVPAGIEGNITIKLNDTVGTTITLPIFNGKAVFDLSDLAAGNYTVNVTYNGNDKYNINGTESATFEVKQISPDLEIVSVVSNADGNATVIVKVNPKVTENVTITVNGKDYTKSVDEDGVVIFTTDVLDYGNYTVTANYAGDKNFTADSDSVNFTTNKTSDYVINITASDITVGNNTNITVNVPADATGKVIINLNGTNYTCDINDGKAVLNNISTLKEGIYTVTAYFGNDKYANKTVETRFVVSKVDTPISIEVGPATVGDTVKVVVTVPSDVTKNVTIEIDGKVFTNVTVDGNATFYVPNITYGNKTVVATYAGDDKYRFNSTTANFEVSKRLPATIVVTTDGPINVGDNITISVDIPANATGYVVVNVNGTNYTINTTSGHGSVVIPNLGNGTWNVTATYLGDDQYLPNSNKTSFVVNKVNSTIVIDVESIDYGNAANITVTVKGDATGYITIQINNTRNVTLPVINGKANWIVEGLAADNYTVYANYSGDAKYDANNSNVNKAFEVRQISPNLEIVTIVANADVNATIAVKVDPRVTENVTINVGGKDYTQAVGEDGVVIFTTDVLDYGTYTVTATYAGDKNFTADTDSVEFTTNKTPDYLINITASDIKVGNNTNITVYVPADATGNVIINLNGTNYTATIENGKAVLNNVSTLKEGVYTVTAYFGNSKYANKTVETRFAVSKVQTPITVEVDPIFVGDKAVITVTVPEDVTGNVTIEIDGKKYNKTADGEGKAIFTIENLTAGTKTIVASYAGDDKYLHNTTTANVVVSKRESWVTVDVENITAGSDAVINVHVPTNATGNVIVSVNGTAYTVNVTNGVGSIAVRNLGNGTYNINVTYVGDDQYLPSTNGTKLRVDKLNTTIEITVQEPINYGQAANITVTVANGVEGTITIKINETHEITLPIYNGKVTWNVSGLAADNYTVYATYNGNDKYNINDTAKATFEVKQISPEIEIVSVVANADDNATIVVKVDPRVTENVTITVNGKDYTKAVGEDGVVIFTTEVLDNDVYTVTANYAGDKNFTADSDSLQFTTNETSDYLINITASDIKVGNNTNITVNVPADASGVVIINLNGTNYTATINNGKAVLNNVSTLKEGIYTVTAYFGDVKYSNKTVETRFVVSKVETPISIEVEPIYVGDKAIITVTVPNDVENNVTIEIEGKKYSAAVDPTTGKAVFTIENLTAGIKTVTATYAGDDKYVFNSTSASQTVSKRNSTVIVDVNATYVGDNVTINVTIPANATGFVVVNVDGTDYTINTTDGKGSVVIPGVGNSTHTVKVTYLGDDQYLPSENTTTYGLAKVDSFIIVNAENITLGDVAIITIEAPEDATGNVTVEIVGVDKVTIDLTEGSGIVISKGLTVGNYTVKVTFNGDDRYKVSENETTFKVSPVASGDLKVVDLGNRTVVVVVPENATGNVTINVNGTNYTAPVVNGTATITLTNETPGLHDIEVIYSGDKNHTGITKNATVVIPKYETPVNVTVADIYVGDTAHVVVELPENATGTVTIEIDGKSYTNATIVDGRATFDVDGLVVGNKTVIVRYSGDDNYVANFTSGNFTVSKRNSTVNVTVDATSVGSDVTINVTIPANATGFVVVNVDGTDYTVNTTDGKGTLVIPGVGNSTHTVKVTYLGDDQYLPSSNETTYGLAKIDSTVKVEAEDITFGDKEVITVTVPTDATGNVTVEIVGVGTYTVAVANGTGVLVVKDLAVDTYTVKVTYNGDDKYGTSENETTFKVSKVVTDEIEVVDQGNGTVVVIVPGNGTGNVTINVNGTNYTVPVVNGTAIIPLGDNGTHPGVNNITVIYSGDENHTGITKNATVVIPKYDAPINVTVADIYVGDTAHVVVELPENATGTVTIEIDGKSYTNATIVDGRATFDVDGLVVGNKTVIVRYSGDDNYVANFTTGNFTVSKRNSTVTVTVVNSTVGTPVTINVEIPANATGFVVINVDGTDYTVNTTDGKGTLTIDGVGNSTHTVKVTYLGDDQYLPSSNETTYGLAKIDSTVKVEAEDITFGDKEVITVTVPTDATGNVTVDVVGVGTYTVAVANGTGVLVVKDLAVGTHTVKVTYNGDDKYRTSENETTFKVSKVVTDEIDIVDQGNGTVTIIVPGNGTGNVTVTVNGTNYTVPVVNGTATVPLGNGTTPGVNNITVIYSGDENHTGITKNATVVMPKYETPIDIAVENVKVGETEVIVVKLPENATGDVTVEINGKVYTPDSFENGVATFNIDGLTYGNKTATIMYSGDDNYVANSTTANFTVNKNPAPISVEVDNSTKGEVTIKVTLPEDATGYVIVNVNGTDYGINLTAGENSVTVPIDATGDYTAKVTYLGDDKYLENSTTEKFHASTSKVPANIGAEVDNVPTGEDVVVKVTVPEGGDGNVTVKIGNITKTVPVTGGENSISIPGVPEGTHDVVIDYSGNDQFEPETINKKVSVFRTINAENITRGWNSPYDYKAEFLDKNGNVLSNTDVQYVVNGKTYTVKTDSQGIAYLDTSKLAVGKYNVTIINTATGEKTTRTTTIVKRLIENKDITMDFVDGTYYVVRAIGDDGKPVGEGEFVDIYVNTIHYSCRTDKNGYAKLQINLNPKTYTITAEYKLTKVSNKLVVKQTLKLVKKTVTVKKGKKFVLQAKLKWSNGKAIKGKKIVFKFKGKKYSAKTNSKGIAKVTIKKSVAKKLKKGKKYKYSATYISNIVKGKVKVK